MTWFELLWFFRLTNICFVNKIGILSPQTFRTEFVEFYISNFEFHSFAKFYQMAIAFQMQEVIGASVHHELVNLDLCIPCRKPEIHSIKLSDLDFQYELRIKMAHT